MALSKEEAFEIADKYMKERQSQSKSQFCGYYL
jgi:hypothetical protein